ncbi:EH domain-containing protein 1 [Trichinella pseudospiralis]|uniref:EH domain-containing protein 1 n=1 Tax=Trichinella pseudospiralis TaxID=6337 RepID=A0A0V1JMI0_TRIPS|nr:EH domain-containing protein 1 [Trichinella pseudospiralis]KRZ36194.1 EH domain-containing protein 1 [Trichinella pseudospiralis]
MLLGNEGKGVIDQLNRHLRCLTCKGPFSGEIKAAMEGGVSFGYGGASSCNRNFANATEFLKDLYKEKILPAEQAMKLQLVYSGHLTDAEFESPPMILVIGQGGVGKTTTIRYLMNDTYPGMAFGPDGTTETFTIVAYGDYPLVVSAETLLHDQKFPYSGISSLGSEFVNKCVTAFTPCPLLKHINFVDTPGIAACRGEEKGSDYDFQAALAFFAEKADLILFLFDAFTMNFSNEMKRVIFSMQQYEEKLFIILNKADKVDLAEVGNVHCSLIWQLGHIMKRREIPPVFIGSLWESPFQHPDLREYYECAQQALLKAIRTLPRSVHVRRLNDVIKRAKLVNMHALIVKEIRNKCLIKKGLIGRYLFKKMAEHLEKTIYPKLIMVHKISSKNLPNSDIIKSMIRAGHLSIDNCITDEMVSLLEEFLSNDITELVASLPKDSQVMLFIPLLKAGRFGDPVVGVSCEPENWCVINLEAKSRHWKELFYSLNPQRGLLHWSKARDHLNSYNLPLPVLDQIWRLADADFDGMVSKDEFYLILWLIHRTLNGNKVPDILEEQIKPPTHLRKMQQNGKMKKFIPPCCSKPQSSKKKCRLTQTLK